MEEQINLLLIEVAYYTNQIEKAQQCINRRYNSGNDIAFRRIRAQQERTQRMFRKKLRKGSEEIYELRAIQLDFEKQELAINYLKTS